MCYPVCGMVHIKEPLLLINKSSLCGGSGFPFSLSEWSLTICLTPYNRRLNVLSVSAVNTAIACSMIPRILLQKLKWLLRDIQLQSAWFADSVYVFHAVHAICCLLVFHGEFRQYFLYQLVVCFQFCSVCMYVYVSVCMQIQTYTYMYVCVCVHITHHNIMLKIIVEMFYFILFKYNTPQTRKV